MFLLFTGSLIRCPSHQYQCGSGECVDLHLVCNGFINCVDGSDEGPRCAQHNCSSQSAPRCDQHCISTPEGPVGTQLVLWGYPELFCSSPVIKCQHLAPFVLNKMALMFFFSAEVLLSCRVQAAYQRFVLCGY